MPQTRTPPDGRTDPAEAEEDTGMIDPALQQQVDENLRLLYRSKLESELPEALQDLVRQLLNEGKLR